MATPSSNSRFNIALGRNVFITTSFWQDQLYIHVRQFEKSNSTDSQRLYPGPKGVGLTLQRFKELQRFAKEMDQCLDTIIREEHTELKFSQHLGGNLYAGVDSSYLGVDLRKFWLPEGEETIAPTRKGIFLTPEQWRLLLSSFEHIQRDIPELNDVTPCYEGIDHSTRTGFLKCRECNPNALKEDI